MGDGAALYLILWLLYFSECFLWIGKQSIAFVASCCGPWRTALPSSFLGSTTSGVVAIWPFLPASRAVIGALAPLSISPDGICSCNLQSLGDLGRSERPVRWLRFETMQNSGREERRLLVNGELFVQCATVSEAELWASLIDKLRQSPAPQRQKVIKQFLDERFAGMTAQSRIASAAPYLWPLTWTSLAVFPLVYLALPVWAIYAGVEAVIIPGAAILLLFAIAMALLFRRAHKQLSPGAGEERSATVVKTILCPPAAFQLGQHLTRNLLAGFDPIVGSALLPGESRQRFAGAYLRDLRYPLMAELADPEAEKIVSWFHAEIITRVEKVLAKDDKLELAKLTKPPVRERDCHSYCPRCHSQFTMAAGECSACPGVTLIAHHGADAVGR